jgi:hypothetical protein
MYIPALGMPFRRARSASSGTTVPWGHSLGSTMVTSVCRCGGETSDIGPYPRSKANTACSKCTIKLACKA